MLYLNKVKFLGSFKINCKYKILIKIIISIFILFLIIFISTYILKPNINNIPYSSVIYDINGERIGEIIKDKKYRHEEVTFDEIPEFTKKAIIILEDKNFWKNNGVDYVGILRALKNNIIDGYRIEGASTITSQLIKNNYWLNEKRTFLRKISEFYLSICVTHKYSKEEILSSYLGNIYFGYLNYGIKSASNYYFGKNLNSLTKAEQIAIILLPKNQSKFDPYKNRQEFKERFKIVVDILKKNNLISNEEEIEIKNEKLIFNEIHENNLPYINDFLSTKNLNNRVINTTIDYNLSKKIDTISKDSIIPIMWKNVKDYSVIIIDRNTKELKTMIGGINYYAKNGEVNGSLSPRQAGSTIKPFTYLLAVKDLGYNKETVINDLPVQFKTNFGYAYNPKNYSLDFKGQVSIAEALSQSINIPAVKTLEKVGVSRLLNFLKLIGITSLKKDENYYGLALTLGVGEISLYELTRAYGIFAYDGKYCEIKYIKGEKDKCTDIIEKKYTDEIKDILTNRYFKLNSFPINGNLDFPDKEVFLKTGTSRNFKDNWTIGYTKNYLIGVWVGNKDGSEMKGVSGASGAGEIFKAIVNELESQTNEIKPIIINKKNEKYLEITSPLNESIFKIDNSKPIESQKIKFSFSTNMIYKKYIMKLNGKEINSNFLDLKKGNNIVTLELIDENNKIISKKEVSYSIE